MKKTIAIRTELGDSLTSMALDYWVDMISQQSESLPLEVCKIESTEYIQNLQKRSKVKIKRTSDRIRNTSNHPDSLERYMIDLYKDLAKMQKPLPPKILLDRSGRIHYFKPISMNHECLSCHGQVRIDVDSTMQKRILDKYPNDQALGYFEGSIGGIWSLLWTDKVYQATPN